MDDKELEKTNCLVENAEKTGGCTGDTLFLVKASKSVWECEKEWKFHSSVNIYFRVE